MSAGTDERSAGLGVATAAVVAVGTLGVGLQLETVNITPTTIGGAVGVVAVGLVAAGLGTLHRW